MRDSTPALALMSFVLVFFVIWGGTLLKQLAFTSIVLIVCYGLIEFFRTKGDD